MSKSDSTLIDRKESFAELKHLLVEKNREIEQLKQEINIMQQVMDYLPLRVFWKDKQGIYLGNNRFNLEATKTYCCLREPEKVKNFRGKTDEDLFLSEFAETHRRTDLEVIRTKKALEEEAAFTNYKGCKIIEFDKKAPLFDSRGQVIGVMGYITDVTHLKNLEAKVKNAGLAKIEFIRHMQHDIKTPFAGITGLTNILLDAETDSKKRDFLKDIILCANELMEYCDRILAFSKATVKNLPLTPLTFRLRDIIDSVINMAMPVAKIKRLYLSLDYAQSLPKLINGYPYRLKSILVNLLNNALQYTPQGQIHLIVKLQSFTGNLCLIQFIIKDTGQGMSSEKRTSIEKQLSHIVTVENDTYEGRGLGLRIISQFARDIGANVSVSSELGIGTTFTVEIPFFRVPHHAALDV